MIIKNIRYGIAEGGIACGPVSGSVIATIEYEDEKGIHYLYNCEFDGIPSIYLSDKDIYDTLMKEELDSVEEYLLSEYEGICLGEYDDFYEDIKYKRSDKFKLLKLLIVVTCADIKVTDRIIKKSTGKDIKNIKLPNLSLILDLYWCEGIKWNAISNEMAFYFVINC